MPLSFWIIFNAVILLLLFLDLIVWNRKGRVIPFGQALIASGVWIALALGFAVLVRYWLGQTRALEFVTGYVVEEALSVDNLFVFILLFAYFKVPPEHERTVLFWGILGALIMRGAFIFAGVGLVRRAHWVLYLLGVFLVYGGFKLLVRGEEAGVDPSRNFVLKLVRKVLPVTAEYQDGRFFVWREGRALATPLFIVLVVVETTDILFATDSIPAILAITRDSFIVYTSNVFAILGLRSMYFALSGLMRLFHYLNYGLALVLMFIGVKMLLAEWYPIPTWVALIVVMGVLAVSVLVSVVFPKRQSDTAQAQQQGKPGSGLL